VARFFCGPLHPIGLLGRPRHATHETFTFRPNSTPPEARRGQHRAAFLPNAFVEWTPVPVARAVLGHFSPTPCTHAHTPQRACRVPPKTKEDGHVQLTISEQTECARLELRDHLAVMRRRLTQEIEPYRPEDHDRDLARWRILRERVTLLRDIARLTAHNDPQGEISPHIVISSCQTRRCDSGATQGHCCRREAIGCGTVGGVGDQSLANHDVDRAGSSRACFPGIRILGFG